MSDLLRLIWYAVVRPFRSHAALQAEILVLRHQLNVLRRRSPEVPTISFRLMYRLVILRHARRELLWLGVPPVPTAKSNANMLMV
jgi:hypothetical protein